MGIEDIKKKIESNIDSNAEDLIGIAKDILDMPEPGYREFKTSRYAEKQLNKYGFSNIEKVSLTGLKTVIDTGRPGPTVCVMGELDSLIVLGHPHADQETNAAHACGHHTQIAQMIAVGQSFNDPEVLKGLSGKIVLIAVPAEENIEVEYRKTLRDEGKIEFLLGKQEFVKLGALDGVDIAMMTHTGNQRDNKILALGGSSTGSVSKSIKFIGKASHAGGSPHNGINALNAANLAMAGIHFQRETFQEKDVIRIHPIITQGGAAVSSVPADVRMETYVRGSSTQGYLDASEKVDRALRGGAMAVGAQVEITTIPGYLPMYQNEDLNELYEQNSVYLVGDEAVDRSNVGRFGGFSTDMGDMSQLMPIIHPSVLSTSGDGHGIDYVVEDYHSAVITAAKAMALTVADLLHGNAEKGKEIVDKFEPLLTKDKYLKLLRSMYKEEKFKDNLANVKSDYNDFL
ncbi:MAG: amidohydrolase [Chloroflexi bacterium]|nr:amidohydrolase [Chloroflexota bacterium]|tara:strand:+ start:3375 stop:4748 length:1374 start_codon:yes stop_codon:yes gene_type:complete